MYILRMSEYPISYRSGRLRVAVVGGGISGIVAAHGISRRHDVVLFEKEPVLGGHTHTVHAKRRDGREGTVPVDMGFIVFNEPNYPVFNRFLAELNVAKEPSDMSFAFYAPQTGFMYAGTGLAGMLARWRNLASPSFWRMLTDMRRFSKEALHDLQAGRLEGRTVGEYLDAGGYSASFEGNYLLPMAGAIWSAPEGNVRLFPAEALVQFFHNHMLLEYQNRPQWYVVQGGSHTYVRAFAEQFTGEIRTGADVAAVVRSDDGVCIHSKDNIGHGDAMRMEQFDAVVLATHADTSLRLLKEPTPDEQRLLGAWHYADNRVVLHSDISFLPPKRSAWASWVYIQETARQEDVPLGVSYHMNRLQNIASETQYIVTLNPVREIAERSYIAERQFAHPQFSLASLTTQKELPLLDGVNRTFFCGAYQGYGFHEDGARSGERVARYFAEEV